MKTDLPINALQKFLAGLPFGFIAANQLPDLIALDRLHPVLVRCGGGRFTCGAQDADHFMRCITAGGDYVRDVSVPAGSIERAAAWVAASSVAKSAADWHFDPVRSVPMVRPAKQAPGAWSLNRRAGGHFDETQCGGVFDGRQVTSDADPGL